jgi:hypothetical protein
MKLIQKITRPATAVILAGAVALSPVSATEARAGSEEALIAGAIGTIILGAIASQALSGNGSFRLDSNSHYRPREDRYRGGHYRDHHRHGGRHDGRGGHRARHYKQLPAKCIIRNTNHGGVLFANRCLKRNFVGADYLPRHCKVNIYNPRTGNSRNAYRGRCLKQAGYSVARR